MCASVQQLPGTFLTAHGPHGIVSVRSPSPLSPSALLHLSVVSHEAPFLEALRACAGSLEAPRTRVSRTPPTLLGNKARDAARPRPRSRPQARGAARKAWRESRRDLFGAGVRVRKGPAGFSPPHSHPARRENPDAGVRI